MTKRVKSDDAKTNPLVDVLVVGVHEDYVLYFKKGKLFLDEYRLLQPYIGSTPGERSSVLNSDPDSETALVLRKIYYYECEDQGEPWYEYPDEQSATEFKDIHPEDTAGCYYTIHWLLVE